MPPHLRTTWPAGADSLTLSFLPGHSLEALLLLCAFITTIRSLVVLCTSRKRSMSHSTSLLPDNAGPARPPFKKADSGTGSDDSNASHPIQANDYLNSLQQETLQPQLVPLHPWIAPPTPLPGPFDAPYYPLPLPTIHAHPSKSPRMEGMVGDSLRRTSTDSILSNDSETLLTRSYTRHPSENSRLPFDPVLEGSTTISSAGWRRTQWTVSAG